MFKTFFPSFLFQKTSAAFLWTRLLNVPFWAIFTLLPFILYKDLHATKLQIMVAVALKPISSLLSPYWGFFLQQNRTKGPLPHLLLGNFVKYIPFLFFPWCENPWIFVFSFGFYMMMTRAVTPAWMEIIQKNIESPIRERVFAFGSGVDYLGSAILPLFFGVFLDRFPGYWKWLFFVAALIGIASTIFLLKIPKNKHEKISSFENENFGFFEFFLIPWKQSFHLLKERVDFRRFQWGFFLGGMGLMVMHPILPVFFVDSLQLSYTEMCMALSVCKAVGFAVTSGFWARLFQLVDIYRFSSWVTILGALFPVFLIAAKFHIAWLYMGYMIYGIMQAGSELSWHFAGPKFAKGEDSSPYSRASLLAVGIRGCIAHPLGTALSMIFPPAIVLLSGSIFLLLATTRMRKSSENPWQEEIQVL